MEGSNPWVEFEFDDTGCENQKKPILQKHKKQEVEEKKGKTDIVTDQLGEEYEEQENIFNVTLKIFKSKKCDKKNEIINSLIKEQREYLINEFKGIISTGNVGKHNLLAILILSFDEEGNDISKNKEKYFISSFEDLGGVISANNFWKLKEVIKKGQKPTDWNHYIARALEGYNIIYNPGDLKVPDNTKVCTEPAAVYYLLEDRKISMGCIRTHIEMISLLRPCGYWNNTRCDALLKEAFDKVGSVTKKFTEGDRKFSFQISYFS